MKRLIPIIMLGVLGAGAFTAYYGLTRRGSSETSGLLHAVGTVEGDRVVIAARSTGQITGMLVEVGEQVSRGQIIATLADVKTQDAAAEARRNFDTLETKLRYEQAELALLQTRIPLAIRAAESNVGFAQAVVARCNDAEAELVEELERLRAIEEPDEVTRQEIEVTLAAHEQAQADTFAARTALLRAQQDLELIRLGEAEMNVRAAEVEVLRSERDAADTYLHTLQNTVANMAVAAPAVGVIAAQHAKVGDVGEPGMPLYDMTAEDSICVMVELTETEAQRVAKDQQARIFESDRELAIDAVVVAIAPAALGEGKWAAKLAPASVLSPGRFSLGSRVDVVIRLRPDASWSAPPR